MRQLLESWASVRTRCFSSSSVVGGSASVPLTCPRTMGRAGEGEQEARCRRRQAARLHRAPAGFGIGSGVVALLGGLVATIAAFFRSGAQVGQFLRNRGFQVSGGLMAMLAAALLLFGVLVLFVSRVLCHPAR